MVERVEYRAHRFVDFCEVYDEPTLVEVAPADDTDDEVVPVQVVALVFWRQVRQRVGGAQMIIFLYLPHSIL